MMKIYGEVAEVQNHIGFTEISTIAIAMSPKAMERFAHFVMHGASEMKRMGTSFDHLHFMDFCTDWDPAWPDVQLTRVYQDFQDS